MKIDVSRSLGVFAGVRSFTSAKVLLYVKGPTRLANSGLCLYPQRLGRTKLGLHVVDEVCSNWTSSIRGARLVF